MKKILFKILRYSGIPTILRETIQKNKVTIITFHDPLPETFKETITYLKKYYNIIPLSLYVEYLMSNRVVPSKAIIITLDDGHKNNYKLLKSIKEYCVPITIFLCSEIVGTTRHFWWTHKINQYNLRHLKKMPEKERRDFYKKFNFDYLTEYGKESRQSLSMEEVNDMLSSGYVDFQSHTMYHALLNKCDDTLSFNELHYSKINLEKKLNTNIYALAYPNGFYSDRDIINAQKSGYKCALSIEPGFNSIKTNPFQLKRLGISDNAKICEIIVKTSGLWGLFKKMKKLILPSI